MKVVFSDRAFAAIMAETTEKIKTETGGLFLGSFEDGIWYVIEAIDPGPKSIFEVAYFEYDQQYTQHLINKIANLYDKKLTLIGLWHRHPGSFDQFSSTDDGTNSKYARMRKEGALSALVNIDPKFRLTMYHVDQPCRYSVIEYDVGNHLIPDEMLRYKSPEKFANLMAGIISDEYKDFHPSVSLNGFLKTVLPYMKRIKLNEVFTEVKDRNIATERILDELVEDSAFLVDDQGIEYSISQVDQFICLSQDAIDVSVKLYFRYISENDIVVFSYNNECYLYENNAFRRAFEQASKVQADNIRKIPQYDRGISITDAVKKIIHINLNKDGK
ncbi:Mov34/MPN/PAD-1 family protein [Blautia sp.]|jgi:integrative and conjugative element protein (TIGR02256 family)|uniref:Mov34/MPN/PAD-1 family protein n=1 Tax=Blautia sp. TaxID=1955243 RepID=UPI0026C7099B